MVNSGKNASLKNENVNLREDLLFFKYQNIYLRSRILDLEDEMVILKEKLTAIEDKIKHNQQVMNHFQELQ